MTATGTDHEAATKARIVEAAAACFMERPIASTTMEQIARRADMSRVWLYRWYPNKHAILGALIGREASAFYSGLEQAMRTADPDSVAVEAFVWGVSWIRGNELVMLLLEREPDLLHPFLTGAGGAAVIGPAIDVLADAVRHRSGIPTVKAHQISEWTVRCILALFITPGGGADLENRLAIRRFAETMLLPAIAAARRA